MQYNKPSEAVKQRAREMLERGDSAASVARALNLKARTVSDWRAEWGIEKPKAKRRRTSGPRRAPAIEVEHIPPRQHSTSQHSQAMTALRAYVGSTTSRTNKPNEGWGAVIEAAPVQQEPDEYFDQSEQMELYNPHQWNATKATGQQLSRLARGLTDRIGVENAANLRDYLPEKRREQRPALRVGGTGLGAHEHVEWMNHNRLALINSSAHQQSAPPQKSAWSRFKDWLNGANVEQPEQPEQRALAPVNNGFSPYNCQNCGSNRLQWGNCLNCGHYKL